MTNDSNYDRRAVLKAGGTALAVGALAGCTADGRNDSGDESRTNDSAGDAATAAEEGDGTDGGDAETVEVGPGGALVFDPGTDEPLTVDPGTTVRFVWDSDTHNIAVEEQPERADWEGTPGGPDEVYDEGYEYTHTFEVPGTYEFYCRPHRSVGMEATIVVEEE